MLTQIAKLGGGYAESVELLKRADAAQRLTAALVVDAIPRQMSVQQLAAFARKGGGDLHSADVEVARVGSIRPDLESVGVDLADPEMETKPDAGPQRAPLSRQPGRIFGPKPTVEPPAGEPQLTPVTPAAGTTPPPEPAPVSPELSRNPGRLFPRK